jgi:putative flippase GtrA
MCITGAGQVTSANVPVTGVIWIEGTVDQVRSIREIYENYAIRIHEIAKFGVVGGIGFVVQLGVTDVVHLGLGVGALTAVIVGYVVATVVTFLGNRHWAFKHRQGKGLSHETLLFILLNVVGLGIQEAVVATVHYGLHMTDPLSYNVANIIGIALGTLFRLWSYRKWVFLEVNEEPAEVAPTVLPAELPVEEHSAPAQSRGVHAAGVPSDNRPSQAPGRHRAPEAQQREHEPEEVYPQASIG